MRLLKRLVLGEYVYESLADVVSVFEEELAAPFTKREHIDDSGVAVELSQPFSPRAVAEAAPSRR